MQCTILKVMLAGLLSPATLFAQQHAPTVEQCRADLALWYGSGQEDRIAYMKAETEHIEYGTPNHTVYAALPLTEVIARKDEMTDCWKIDGNSKDYYEAMNFYYDIFASRALSFIRRHHLMQQFRNEDAAGLR